jgi:Glyoxalase/Bleomycin resistance protein/Dioxygenase superfamily
MRQLQFVAPVLPMTDVDRTADHYRRLGFSVDVYNPEYVMVARDGVEMHFGLMPDHDPKRTAGCVWLLVEDADALYEEWVAAAVGDTRRPFDTHYKIREGAHIDRDGNLLRFGSPLPGWRAG